MSKFKAASSIGLAFVGAAACGVAGALAWATPVYFFIVIPGLAAFIAGASLLNRVAIDEAERTLQAENFALREELDRMRPQEGVLPNDLLKTTRDLKHALERMGSSAVEALGLVQAAMGQAHGVETHVAGVQAENAELRADNALLDHVSKTIATRGRRIDEVMAMRAPVDLDDRRVPSDFAPPAAREAARRRIDADPVAALQAAVDRPAVSETEGLKAVLQAIEARPALPQGAS